MDEKALRSFGRIKGRPLKPRQAALIEQVLPTIAIPPSGPICPMALFPDEKIAIALEIGFGAGEHLAAQAKRHADWGFLGVEPFLNGVGACLRRIEEAQVANVRLHQGDARDVLARLPASSLDRIFILFPDPWPKTRHWKRRLIQPAFVAELARVLKPGGAVLFATDWADYAAWTLGAFVRAPLFAWVAECAADWRTPWPDHVATRYQQKQLGDCAPIFFEFVRDST